MVEWVQCWKPGLGILLRPVTTSFLVAVPYLARASRRVRKVAVCGLAAWMFTLKCLKCSCAWLKWENGNLDKKQKLPGYRLCTKVTPDSRASNFSPLSCYTGRWVKHQISEIPHDSKVPSPDTSRYACRVP